jgi:hypothetical protein
LLIRFVVIFESPERLLNELQVSFSTTWLGRGASPFFRRKMLGQLLLIRAKTKKVTAKWQEYMKSNDDLKREVVRTLKNDRASTYDLRG